MAIYVLRDGRMVNKKTGEPMVTGEWQPVAPMVYGDLPDYRSPVDGAVVHGRRARRYDLEKNNCIDGNDLPSVSAGGFKNERFAKKHGLPFPK